MNGIAAYNCRQPSHASILRTAQRHPGNNVNNTGTANDSINANTTVNSITFSTGGTATLTILRRQDAHRLERAILLTNNTSLTITGGGTHGWRGRPSRQRGFVLAVDSSVSVTGANLTGLPAAAR